MSLSSNSNLVFTSPQFSSNNSNSSSAGSQTGDSIQINSQSSLINNQKVRKKSTFPFGKCKVCNDKATGVHYGISTCEGCKGFFKRSILRNEYYKCFFGNNCVLNPKNRNRCKACRFKKCIQAGMSFSGIKMGRIPKAEKIKAIENLKQTGVELDEEEYDEDEEEDEANTSSGYNKRYEMRKELENNLAVLTNNILKNNSISNMKISDENDENSVATHKKSKSNNFNNNNNNNQKKKMLNISRDSEVLEDDDDDSQSDENNELTVDKTSMTTNTSSSPSESPIAKLSGGTNKTIKLEKYEDYMTKFLKVLEKTDEFAGVCHNPHLNFHTMHPNHKETTSNKQIAHSRSSDMFMKNLLDLHRPLKTSNILPTTNYAHMFTTSFNQNDLSYHIISSLINDKIYQLYNSHFDQTQQVYERAKMLSLRRDIGILGNNSPELTLERVWSSLVQSIPDFVKTVILFGKEVPGLNELSEVDFATIINNKLFDFFVIMNSILFINGESYLHLPNEIHYTRYWMNRIKGKSTTDALFEFVQELNDLNLTNKEKALLIVLVFTMPDLDIQDQMSLQDLNEYYTRSILYEFDLNKRDSLFLFKFKKVLQKLKENRILQSIEDSTNEHQTDCT